MNGSAATAELPAAERRRRRAQPAAEAGDRPFFQREIVEWLFAEGTTTVCAVRLSCGHRQAYKTRCGGPSGAKTKSCSSCGSGSRTYYERRLSEGERRRLFDAALADPERRDALMLCTALIQHVLATKPSDGRQREVWSQLDRYAAKARIWCPEDYTQARG